MRLIWTGGVARHPGDPRWGLVERFWERAGRVGYRDILYPSRRVSAHVVGWPGAGGPRWTIEIADGAAVLDLGCGDGQFAIEILPPRFRRVDGVDRSHADIERARARSHPDHVQIAVGDLARHEYLPGQRWDAAFLLGVLNHLSPLRRRSWPASRGSRSGWS